MNTIQLPCLWRPIASCLCLLCSEFYIKPLLTVLVIIKLKKFAVPVRLRCGSSELIFLSLFHHVLRYLRTLYILDVSPGSKQCATLLNIAKYFKTLRCGCGAVAFIFSIHLKPVHVGTKLFSLFQSLFALFASVRHSHQNLC